MFCVCVCQCVRVHVFDARSAVFAFDLLVLKLTFSIFILSSSLVYMVLRQIADRKYATEYEAASLQVAKAKGARSFTHAPSAVLCIGRHIAHTY